MQIISTIYVICVGIFLVLCFQFPSWWLIIPALVLLGVAILFYRTPYPTVECDDIPENCTETPCMLAYLTSDGALEFLPYFDEKRKHDIFGAFAGRALFKITEEVPRMGKVATYSLFSQYSQKLFELRLPDKKQFKQAYRYKDDFNETMAFLRSKGVKADNWKEGCYYLRRPEFVSDDIFLFNMGYIYQASRIKTATTCQEKERKYAIRLAVYL